MVRSSDIPKRVRIRLKDNNTEKEQTIILTSDQLDTIDSLVYSFKTGGEAKMYLGDTTLTVLVSLLPHETK